MGQSSSNTQQDNITVDIEPSPAPAKSSKLDKLIEDVPVFGYITDVFKAVYERNPCVEFADNTVYMPFLVEKVIKFYIVCKTAEYPVDDLPSFQLSIVARCRRVHDVDFRFREVKLSLNEFGLSSFSSTIVSEVVSKMEHLSEEVLNEKGMAVIQRLVNNAAENEAGTTTSHAAGDLGGPGGAAATQTLANDSGISTIDDDDQIAEEKLLEFDI